MLNKPTPAGILAADGENSVAREGSASRLEDEVVALFDQFRDRLLRYLLSLGLTIADSEETIQEVFLALHRHLQQDKPKDHLRGWLFRVAHNLGLKRREKIRKSGETVYDACAAEQLSCDPAPNPEAALIQSQTQERLMAVFQALPEQDRRCLSLRAEGLQYREIAAVLDISLGAVSLSLARSLGRMMRASER